MKNTKIMECVLRISVAGEFLGHGAFAILGKADWIKWTVEISTGKIFGVQVFTLSGLDIAQATSFIFYLGIFDIILAVLILVKPIRGFLLWMTFWGFFTALLRPMVGLPVWDFIERFANWGAPLALYFLVKDQQKDFSNK